MINVTCIKTDGTPFSGQYDTVTEAIERVLQWQFEKSSLTHGQIYRVYFKDAESKSLPEDYSDILIFEK